MAGSVRQPGLMAGPEEVRGCLPAIPSIPAGAKVPDVLLVEDDPGSS